MRHIALFLLVCSVGSLRAAAQVDAPELPGASGIRAVLRAVGEDSGTIIQLSRETLDFILRTPAIVTTSKVAAILPDDAFHARRPDDDRGAWSTPSPWSAGVDSVLVGGMDLLSDLIAYGHWTLVHPPIDRNDSLSPAESSPMQARMAIPLSPERPIEARLGIETDSVREDYFVFSTELSTSNPIENKWLAWSTRLDYRSNVEAPSSARAEQRVALRFGSKDTLGISGRIEDRNVAMATSLFIDLAPAGEVFWNHRWLPSLESSLKVQQVLPDLQALWLSEPGSSVQVEANVRASLNAATRVDVRGTATQDFSQFGIRLQLEFLLGTPGPQSPERITVPDVPEPPSERGDFGFSHR